mmetsp:Transcript_7494/g.8649  ORF Transcript_7494/g.8649 Transcript_7494/m.8649 type:complete len:469 (+) Transcript_7494:78-1484(+)
MTTMILLMTTMTMIMMVTVSPALSFLLSSSSSSTLSLSLQQQHRSSIIRRQTISPMSSSSFQLQLTLLPKDISPFDKSSSKGRDVQGEIRKLATIALQKALVLPSSNEDDDGTISRRPTLLELEFPPLIGGDRSKSQFDDFDNVQELNQNRDWCVEWLPTLAQSFNKEVGVDVKPSSSAETSSNAGEKNRKKNQQVWFVLPDTKEVELCKEEWKGKLYRQAATFTSIEAVAEYYFTATTNNNNNNEKEEGYSKPWGATIANAVNQLIKGGGGSNDTNDNENDTSTSTTSTGLLGDTNALDPLTENTAAIHLVCQPGNGGPVEDWINVKKFHEKCIRNNNDDDVVVPTIVVNGALNKVRDGYYAPFIFPKLAKTFDFYKSFEQLVYLKPISDKGLYGWTFKVYSEPWQVVLQRPTTVIDKKSETTTITVEDIVALVSETKPTYQESIQALVSCNVNANANANAEANSTK